MLERYINAQLALQEPERIMVRRPIPINAGNHRASIEVERELDPQPPDVAETFVDEDFVDLVAMVREAGMRGWARNQWVKRPRLKMPSGRPMNRGLYDKLTDLAAQPWRIIHKSGIAGETPSWEMDILEAVEMLERVYAAQFGPDGEVLPIEDPAA